MTPKKTILIVEDDTDIRDSLVEVLESEGYGVTTASNGREALDLLARRNNDDLKLILLDLMMPVMDGRTFLKHMQSEMGALYENVPVVIVTAAGEALRAEIEAVGYLKKPIELDTLLNLVQVHCGA